MSDAFNIRRNVVSAFVEFVVNLALVFISYRLVIERGGLEALGLWATLYAWTMLIRIGDIGMSNAVLRFVSLHDAQSDRRTVGDFAQTGIIANTALFAVLALIGYLAFRPFVEGIAGSAHAAEAVAVLPIMFAGLFLFNVSGVVLSAVQGLHLGYLRSAISVAGAATQLMVAILMVPELGLMGLAWAQVAQYALMAVAGWAMLRHRLELPLLPWRFSRPAFSRMLSFSVTSQAASLANGLFEPVAKILVAHFGGLAMQGVFELAYKSIWLPRNAVIAAVSAMTPSMTARVSSHPQDVARAYQRSTRLATALVAAICVVVVLATPIIALLWIGEMRIDYTGYAAIIAVGVVCNAAGAAAYNLGIVLGQMGGNLMVSSAALVALPLLAVPANLLAPQYGLVIAIAAVTAAAGIAIRMVNGRRLRATLAAGGAGFPAQA